MAEGLARQIFPDAEVYSAGSQPGVLNPMAVRALQEVGLDISKHFAKSIEQICSGVIRELDYVITLCAEEVCPLMPGTHFKKLHWPHMDPATQAKISDGELLERFRTVRDQIKERLLNFRAAEMAGLPGATGV